MIFIARGYTTVRICNLQVASMTKGVTARGVAAAAGAGLGIGFSGGVTIPAKQAELIAQRERHVSQLQNFARVHQRAQNSVRCSCTHSYLHVLRLWNIPSTFIACLTTTFDFSYTDVSQHR